MQKFIIQSYQLQDGRWGSAVIIPAKKFEDSVSISEPVQFGKYFDLKDDADKYAVNFLITEVGLNESDIEII